MSILLFSFLVILYRYLAIETEVFVKNFDIFYLDNQINPPHQFEVHLHYPRVAHLMFWEGRIRLFIPFPPFRQ